MDNPENVATETPAEAAAPAEPVCPYCGDDPAKFSLRPLVGPLKLMAVFCGNPVCRKVFTITATGQPEARVLPGSAFNGGRLPPHFPGARRH